MTSRLLAAETVADLARRVLAAHGVPATHAALQTDILMEAELRGLPSHGLQRLPRIAERLRRGLIVPGEAGSGRWAAPALFQLDGRQGLGPVVAVTALDAVADRARSLGVAMAAIRDANHLGMLSWYVERVAAAGQVAIALSTSEALVHPQGGRRALIGTNPVAIGVPTAAAPFVLDMATSLVPMGRIHVHALRGEPAVGTLHTTNGRWDIVAEVRAESLESFDAALTRIRMTPGIANTETSILLSTYKA